MSLYCYSRSVRVFVLAVAVGCSDSRNDGIQAQLKSPGSGSPVRVAELEAAKKDSGKSLSYKTAASQENIYDETADGVQQIADALAIAEGKHQRVLLQFGANWCGWCRKLHTLFETDKEIANKIDAEYIVVLIDVNNDHNKEMNEKYGRPTRFGLPAIVILDGEGNQLTTKDSAELEEGDHHSPAKVLAFLEEWSPRKEKGAF